MTTIETNEGITRIVKHTNVGVEILGTIDTDYSLIRYLLKYIRHSEVYINESGYLELSIYNEKKIIYTTIHRLILEYYSKYSNKLKEHLKNPNIEIDHINNIVSCNNINNLQVVTKQDNLKKRDGLKYNVEMTQEELKELEYKSINNSQQLKDKKYLINKSKLLEKQDIQDNKSWLDTRYYYIFSNNIKVSSNNVSNVIPSNTSYNLNIAESRAVFFIKNKDIIDLYNVKILQYVLNINEYFIHRYMSKYKYLQRFISKMNISNNKESIKREVNNQEGKKDILHVLFELIQNNYSTRNRVNVLNNNIWCSIDISRLFYGFYGKYRTFRFCYLLGLIERKPIPIRRIEHYHTLIKKYTYIEKYRIISLKKQYKKINNPSFLSIPLYTHKLFQRANKICKTLLERKIDSCTYFIIGENFGIDMIDKVYKNSISRTKYINSLRVKEDVINTLKTFVKDYNKLGYFTLDDIYSEVEYINNQRKLNCLEYNKINPKCLEFIRRQVLYSPDTIKVMNDIGVIYRTTNVEDVENVRNYQIKKGVITPILTQLGNNNKVFLLRKVSIKRKSNTK